MERGVGLDEIAGESRVNRPLGKPGGVVLGGDYQGLGIVRSLARAGIPVIVADRELSISRFSRYPAGFYRRPDWDDELGLVCFLLRLASEKGVAGWVLYPTDDGTVEVLSRNRGVLGRSYIVPTPEWDVVKHFCDKRVTYELATKLGVDIPRTYFPGDYWPLALLDIPYPAIVKPASRGRFYSALKKKALPVNDFKELVAAFRLASSVIDHSELLVQEVIPGGSENQYSFASLCKDGDVLASLVARRTRQHPMDFGHASTYVQTVDIPELEVIGKRLLAAVGYSGLSEVEFKYDPRDGKFKFLEVNPRTWGWHSIGTRAGVDFTFLLYRSLMGEDVQVEGFKIGVKWLRLATDLPTVVREIAKRRIGLRQYLDSWTGDVEFAVFSLEDPLPFFAEFLMAGYLYRKRGF
ncbi:MAG: ATP-grasp domain-containing protein [Actinobacteria bacterium]|nr:ATP-grasp domain-containing protein [Actinomycetota bacterium]